MENIKLKEKIKIIKEALNRGLVGREEEINLILLALLTGENILLLGEPGTAKSEMSRRIQKCLSEESNYFEYLLTRFTTPEEIFGGISILKLKEGKQERMIEGYLPNAHVCFLDEIFKANSSILNSLLTLANERIYHDGPRKIETPLRVIVGASNELPTETELEALYDRFIFRKEVLPVSDEDIIELLKSDSEDCIINKDLKFTFEELDRIKKESKNVILGKDALILLRDIRIEINKYYKKNGKNIGISDRRLKKMAKILKIVAYTNDRLEVDKSDFYILENVLWDKLENRLEIKELLINMINDRRFMVNQDMQKEMTDKIFKFLSKNSDKNININDINLNKLKKDKNMELQEIKENIWLDI